ncbi:hypothetical protein AgCh_025891 [Apium graveolens]
MEEQRLAAPGFGARQQNRLMHIHHPPPLEIWKLLSFIHLQKRLLNRLAEVGQFQFSNQRISLSAVWFALAGFRSNLLKDAIRLYQLASGNGFLFFLSFNSYLMRAFAERR